jgi:hypothetical protein
LPPAPARAADAFKAAFTGVWNKIPTWDRHRLLAFWRPTGEKSAQEPLIRVLPARLCPNEEVVFDEAGAELGFPMVLLEDPQRLAGMIARTLADVLRFATREHYRLIRSHFDEPVERWEKEQGREVSFEEREAKLDEQEKEFHAAYEARMCEILAGWGFDGPPAS